MAKKVVELIDATFSDSFYETYGFVSKDNLLSSFKAASNANIKYMEIGGNIAFLSSIYHLQEAAFSDFDLIRKYVAEDVNLQVSTYSMGGFSSEFLDYELINKFAKTLNEHQITTVRNFDPLNSINNLDFSSHIYEQNGLLLDVTIMLHNNYKNMDYYIKLFKELANSYIMFNSISIIDNFGTVSPTFVYELITLAKEILGSEIYISLGIKNSASTAILSYISAIDAGVDALYLSNNIKNYAYSYPDILTMINLGKDLNFIFNQIEKKDVIEYKNILKRVIEGIKTKNKEAPSNDAYDSLIPLDELEFFKNKILNSNNEDLMRNRANIFKEFDEVIHILNLKSVTRPFSNNVFNQAVNNVLYGKWRKINESFMRNIIHNQDLFMIKDNVFKALIEKYLDYNFYENSYKEAIDKLLKCKNIVICDETIIISTISEVLDEKIDIFNEVIEEVFKIDIGNKKYLVKIKEESEDLELLKVEDESSYSFLIKSQKKGIIEEIKVLIGDEVIEGEVLMILKSKNEEIEVVSKFDSYVENIYVQEGDEVKIDSKLILLSV